MLSCAELPFWGLKLFENLKVFAKALNWLRRVDLLRVFEGNIVDLSLIRWALFDVIRSEFRDLYLVVSSLCESDERRRRY